MNMFYTTMVREDRAILSPDESRHCLKVLRKVVGDEIRFTDGEGKIYTGTIISAGNKKCVVQISDEQYCKRIRPFELHVFMAPTKNINRTEWALEKMVEIGIDSLTFIICDHSERKKIRMDRLDKVALTAMKQSLSTYLPMLSGPYKFAEQIVCATDDDKTHLIAHCGNVDREFLFDVANLDSDLCLYIGPEGDFSEREIKLAVDQGMIATSLGPQRLRTETAALVMCSQIDLLAQMQNHNT